VRHHHSLTWSPFAADVEVTAVHNALQALAHRAAHDSLTEVLNRAAFHDRLGSAMSILVDDQRVAVAVIDIDQLKRVNDGTGHSSGDDALRAVADRLQARLQSTDLVARLGGDEFAVLRIGVHRLEDAEQLGTAIMEWLDAPFVLPDRTLALTFSVGVALSTTTDSPESLFRDADDAMYQAKCEGRDRAIVFDEHARSRAHRRQSVAIALRQALERDELHLKYQPILNLFTRKVVGVESLLRWDHPELGTITPDEFISIAEATGQILPIGAWALDHSLRQLAAWRSDPLLPPNLWMAINMSAQQMAQPHLVDLLCSAIDRAGVPPSALHLEIAESVLMDRVDKALRTIVEIQRVGISVSIDDFGTGYSSLSYLSRLPVDALKIDRSFVGGLGNGARNDTSIVHAMMALARSLHLDVVAEGVETAGQLVILRELGCGYGQGFLWSRPLDATAARAWLIDHAAVLAVSDGVDPGGPAPDSDTDPDVGEAIMEIARDTGKRRRGAVDSCDVLRFDSLEIGLTAGRVWIAGRDLELTAREFELLSFLAQHAGETFTRDDLLREVWQSSSAWQNPATVTEHIRRLRTRIEPDPARPRLICTVRGRGYCFGPPRSP
jgi:diguanylate cyclase (GGDEF)-like protein